MPASASRLPRGRRHARDVKQADAIADFHVFAEVERGITAAYDAGLLMPAALLISSRRMFRFGFGIAGSRYAARRFHRCRRSSGPHVEMRVGFRRRAIERHLRAALETPAAFDAICHCGRLLALAELALHTAALASRAARPWFYISLGARWS